MRDSEADKGGDRVSYTIQQLRGEYWVPVQSYDTVEDAFGRIAKELGAWSRAVDGFASQIRVMDTSRGLEVVWPYIGWTPPSVWMRVTEWRTQVFDQRRDREVWWMRDEGC